MISGVLAGSLPYQLLSLLLQVFCAGTTLFGGRRTSAGEERLRRLLGLRRYLCRADSASLQRLTLQDPQYFYRMLPFAEEMGVGGRFVRCAAGLELEPCLWLEGAAPRRAGDFFARYAAVCARLRGEDGRASAVSRRPAPRPAARTASRPAPQRRTPPFAAPEPQRPPMRPHRREEYDPDEV